MAPRRPSVRLTLLALEARDLPSFSAATPYPVGRAPDAVAVADLNGDKHKDLIVANTGDKFVGVLIARADGTYRTPVNYAVRGDAGSVAVADFNGDKKLDLVVTAYYGGNVSVLFGRGDGTFQPSFRVLTQLLTNYSVAVGDFNNDGKADFVVGGLDAVEAMLSKDGTTFQGHTTSFTNDGNPDSVVASMAVGDFNGDHKLDIAVAGRYAYGDSALTILIGRGDGTFKNPSKTPISAGDHAITARDVNGDGHTDLILSNDLAGTVSVFAGKGTGGFRAAVDSAAGKRPHAVTTGDMDRNKKLDILTADEGGDSVTVLLNR